MKIPSLFKKKKQTPVEQRDVPVGDDWRPDIQNSEWIEGVHPDIVKLRTLLRNVRLAGLGIIAAITIHFLLFCVVAFVFNVVFSIEFSMFVFGVNNINPFHIIGVYFGFVMFKLVCGMITDEFHGFEFFSSFENETEDPNIVVMPDEATAKTLKKQSRELNELKRKIRSID